MNNTIYKCGFSLDTVSQCFIDENNIIKNKLPIALYLEAHELLEKLSLGYISQAFKQLDWSLQLHQEPSVLMEQTEIVPRYTSLVKHLTQKMQKFSSPAAKTSTTTPIEYYQTLLLEYPCVQNELILLNNCGPHLRDALQDKIHPLQLLFPGGDLNPTQNFYQKSVPSFYAQTLYRKCIELFLQNLADNHLLRILEIGAGVGSTAKLLLDLIENNVEYMITDISRVFLKKAQDVLKENSFIKYQLLNIESDNLTLPASSYDIVIASNVLHATASITESLTNIRSLLSNNGIILLHEETKQQTWLDISFGLTDGWWRFSDYDLRMNYPLLEEKIWTRTLNENGFKNVMAFSPSTHWTSTFFIAMKA
jgi:ubiquinone/menaquinone biosynthesis C-methylase UbiE